MEFFGTAGALQPPAGDRMVLRGIVGRWWETGYTCKTPPLLRAACSRINTTDHTHHHHRRHRLSRTAAQRLGACRSIAMWCQTYLEIEFESVLQMYNFGHSCGRRAVPCVGSHRGKGVVHSLLIFCISCSATLSFIHMFFMYLRGVLWNEF